MTENIEKNEYAVKYRVIPLNENRYILFPVKLQKGGLKGNNFITSEETIPTLDKPKSLKEKYVIGAVYSADDLRLIYDDFEEEKLDDDFLGEFYFTDEKEKIIYAETDNNNEIKNITTIDLGFIKQKEENAIYQYDKDVAAVVLNEDALDTLLKTDDIKELKLLLQKYRQLVNSFKDYSDKNGVTRVKVIDGKIDEIETNMNVSGNLTTIDIDIPCETVKKDEPIATDFSYQGLRDYIKEYVFGQDEAIDTFAQKLYMNCTAIKGEPVESILLVGPTGTGKTETIEAAGRYLNIPYFAYNASNLNAEGIKGTSVENVLCSLYELAGKDLAKAQRGLVFFDEFDKLNDSELETKTILKNILLTFNGGGKFPIVTDKYNLTFDTLMTNKVYAGVFQRIADSKKLAIGFGEQQKVDSENTESDIRRKIIEKKYFTLEELSRISTILPYHELDRETKIRILKESKLSTLVQKKKRYKRQFGLDIELTDDFIDAIIEKLDNTETGMRSLNNILKRIMDCAEKQIILTPTPQYKK